MKNDKIKAYIEIIFGTVLVAFGFYFFLLSTQVISGGMMGISIIINHYFVNFPISIVLYIGYGVLLLCSLIFLGKDFFLKSIISTVLTPTITLIFELTISPDFFVNKLTETPILLSSVISGLCLGVGIGIVLRNNASTGGIDILQKILNKKLHLPFSLCMFLTDGVIVVIASIINFELALYGIISLVISAVIIDLVSIEGKYGYTAFIVTDHIDKIKEEIFSVLERGVTIVNVIGGYSNSDKKMLICSIPSIELYRMKELIRNSDKEAFIFYVKTKETYGVGFGIKDPGIKK
jgi:uncharacterized membrane-anchored protein YitT (DUF2179 family)